VLFAKFYSPQWILWVNPLLILAAKRRIDILPIVFLDIVTYIYFPISYDLFGYSSAILTVCIVLKTLLLTGIWVALMLDLIASNRVFTLLRNWFKRTTTVSVGH
jgi:hypothetical protein